MKPQAARLDIRKNFFLHSVIDPWNRIPPEFQRKKKTTDIKRDNAKYRDSVVLSQMRTERRR